MRAMIAVAVLFVAGCGPRAELVDAVQDGQRAVAECYRDAADDVKTGRLTKPEDVAKSIDAEIKRSRAAAYAPLYEHVDAAESMGADEYAARLRDVAAAYEPQSNIDWPCLMVGGAALLWGLYLSRRKEMKP